MSKKLSYLLFFLVFSASRAFAQVSGPPHVFVAGTVISPDEMNLNFSTIFAAALNRSGGTMTGNLLFSADNTLDIGASGATRARDLFLGRNAVIGGTLGVTGATTLAALSATTGTFSSTLGVTGNATVGGTLGVTGVTTLAAVSATTGSFSSTLAVTGAATLTSTLAVNSTSAAAIDVAGGITAGSGNVAVIDTTGKIPAISSTYFASLSGANLTGILESAITDSTILARVASTETISGTWTFTSGVTNLSAASSPFLNYIATGQAANNQFWRTGINGSTWFLSALDDSGVSGNFGLQMTRSGTTPVLFTVSADLTSTGTVSYAGAGYETGTQNETTATSGTNTITLAATTRTVRVTTAGVGDNVISTVNGGAAGRKLRVCTVSTASGGVVKYTFASADSGAIIPSAGCFNFWYDGTTSAWRRDY